MMGVSPKNKDYWRKRAEILEQASNEYGQQAIRKINPSFSKAEAEIDKQIAAWYQRFADNNQITMQEARKMLADRDLAELKWDVDEYIKYGRENNLDGKWIKQLENASARFHISRLEALKIRTQQAAEAAFGNELDEIDALARRVVTEGYYHGCFEIQKGIGVGWDIGTIDDRKLDKILSTPWTTDGKTFSDRIWTSKQQLISEVNKQLTRTCIMGKAPDDAISAISKAFDVSMSQAGRLVMTEQAYFHAVSQKEAYEELEVEEFEVVATLDNATSKICREMDGKHFPIKDYEPGVTAPPFHPWCRSVTAPWFEDDFGVIGERAARDADGKTYNVPANMTYEEWEKKFAKDAHAPRKDSLVRESDVEMYERYKSVLKELCPKTLEEFLKIKYDDKEGRWKQLKYQYRTVNQYKIDSGELSVQEILDLDERIISEKRDNFASDYRKPGNIAGAYIDDDKEHLFLAHSQINEPSKATKYRGKQTLVLEQPNKRFKYIDVTKRDGSIRDKTYVDTEAKLFEYFALLYEEKPFTSITILSERGMCDSCLGVMQQFIDKYGVTVNAVSNKKVEGNVWGFRRREKKK